MKNDPTELVLRRLAARIVERLKNGQTHAVLQADIAEIEGLLINDMTAAGFVRIVRPDGEVL